MPCDDSAVLARAIAHAVGVHADPCGLFTSGRYRALDSNMSAIAYECNCLSGLTHSHVVDTDVARRRGQHIHWPAVQENSVVDASRGPTSEARDGVPVSIDGAFRKNLGDAVRGCLWGMMIGEICLMVGVLGSVPA